MQKLCVSDIKLLLGHIKMLIFIKLNVFLLVRFYSKVIIVLGQGFKNSL
jgi:hypothetical protein